jgi:hypothetical protein
LRAAESKDTAEFDPEPSLRMQPILKKKKGIELYAPKRRKNLKLSGGLKKKFKWLNSRRSSKVLERFSLNLVKILKTRKMI